MCNLLVNSKIEEEIQGLYKQKYDNMADYLKKKQERIDSQNNGPANKKGRFGN